jgi:hypothetical protein
VLDINEIHLALSFFSPCSMLKCSDLSSILHFL